MLLFAYFDALPALPVETSLFRPAEFRYVSAVDKCRLQKSMLKCRWCTIDRIEAAMPALSRLAMVQRWHEEYLSEEKGGFLDEQRKNFIVTSEILAEAAPLPDSDNIDAMKEHFLATSNCKYLRDRYHRKEFAKESNPTGEDDYLPYINYWSWIRDKEHNIHKTLNGADAVLGVRCIPDWLLDGPWTNERVTFLLLLRQGMRYVSRDNLLAISHEALFRGMEEAITGQTVFRRMTILSALLELWCHVYGPRFEFQHVVIPASHPLPLRLFHLAAQTDPHDSTFMNLLVRANVISIPPDDSILTRWALNMKATGNGYGLGQWLLNYMTIPDLGDEYGSLFNNGALSWRRHEMNSPFPVKSFTEQIGYMHERAANARPTAPDGGPCG